MNQDEIIAMAKEASSMARLPWNGEWIFRSKKELMAFAALVAAKERDACAQVCDGMHEEDRPSDYAYSIRARGTKEGV